MSAFSLFVALGGVFGLAGDACWGWGLGHSTGGRDLRMGKMCGIHRRVSWGRGAGKAAIGVLLQNWT